jgi:hypothetical protein
MKDPDDYKEEKGCLGLKWPLLVKIRNMFCELRCLLPPSSMYRQGHTNSNASSLSIIFSASEVRTFELLPMLLLRNDRSLSSLWQKL